ncbi:MAG: DUF4097 domain-containing protein [Nitrososphaerota archaeon]|jgi:DUF4097 and DUF4098 domain-containing protein YvlB|nr:DUF4097 domain-containing protein [Candidatus Termitimicrobium sp.]MDR0492993.1 DUF4097 domain-containing protein [Nitrososphaerota archaeon]
MPDRRKKALSKRKLSHLVPALVIVIGLTVVLVILQLGLFSTPVPLDQREDRTVYALNANVVINATIFSGNIEIQPTTGDQIEVIYTIKAPRGELSTITTKTDETITGDQTTLITSAKGSKNYINPQHTADLLIKLPASSQYTLMLLSGSGDIIIPKLNINKVSVSTTKGNINIKNDGNSNSIEAISMNGNIQIGLAKNTLFQVAASVENGTIEHPEITLNTEEKTALRLKGTTSAGEGTLSLTLMSANGNITIAYLN